MAKDLVWALPTFIMDDSVTQTYPIMSGISDRKSSRFQPRIDASGSAAVRDKQPGSMLSGSTGVPDKQPSGGTSPVAVGTRCQPGG